MTAVYGKELSAYFKNPQGYICLAVYYLLGGQFFDAASLCGDQ